MARASAIWSAAAPEARDARRSSASHRRASPMCPRSQSQKRQSAPPRRGAPAASLASRAPRSAGRTLSCSSPSRCSHAACSRAPEARLRRFRQCPRKAACRARTATASPLASSRSRATPGSSPASRSGARRGPASGRSRLLSTSEARPSRSPAARPPQRRRRPPPPRECSRRRRRPGGGRGPARPREQVVAPVERGPQRPLPGRGVARPAQQGQPAPQAGQQRRRREERHPGRGQLHRQGQPVQAVAQLRHRRGVLVGDGEVGPRATGPGDEQRHRLVLRQPGRLGRCAGSGSASGGTGRRCSPRTPSGARLVASTDKPGHAASRSATSARPAGGARSCRGPAAGAARAGRSPPPRPAAAPPARGPAAPGPGGGTSAGSPRRQGRRGTRRRGRRRAVGGGLERQAGLAHPAGPVSVSRRTSWRSRRARTAASSRSRPTSGVGCTGRLCARRVERLQRREVGGRSGCTQLGEALRARQVLQAVRAQVAQPRPRGQRSRRAPPWPGEHHLPAVAAAGSRAQR